MTEEQGTAVLDLLGKLYLAVRLAMAVGFIQVGVMVAIAFGLGRRR